MKQGQEGGEMTMNTNKPQGQQPQKCPRCDSLNTKFCYYNNYSLSQPRYFCKTCRRYWTQGGTLRNVRVGGGCRKAKRTKSSAATSSSAADPPQQQPPPAAAAQRDPSSAVASASSAPTPALAAPEARAISPFFHGGDGYLSSLAAIQSMNPSQPFNQMGTSSSNLSLLSGFGVPSLGSPIRPSQQFYQMGVIRDKEEDALFEAEQGLIQSSNWPGSFISDTSHKGSDASLWSRTTVSTNTSIGGSSKSNNDATASGSLSLIPNPHWPDLHGYDPPP